MHSYGRRATRGEWWRSPLPFFENQNKCSNFGKKGSDCVHPWVKSSTQNVVLRVSRRKNSQSFSLRSLFFLYRIFDEMFIEVS